MDLAILILGIATGVGLAGIFGIWPTSQMNYLSLLVAIIIAAIGLAVIAVISKLQRLIDRLSTH